MNLKRLRLTIDSITARAPRDMAAIAAVFSVLLAASAARALDTQAYSFENDLEGWTNNDTSGFITVTQDTIGATSGTHSMKVDVGLEGTFEGALSLTMPPIVATPPASPGVDHLHFDVTIPEQFTGNFADIGVTVFGQSNPTDGSMPIGGQIQFSGFTFLEGRQPGTYRDLRIDLLHGSAPALGVPDGKYSDVIGPGPNQMTPTSFELFFNKSGGFPLTVYIDNIRLGAKVLGDYNLNDVVDAADYTLWRDTLGGTGANRAANGDNTGTSMNVVDIADYNFWKGKFGNVSGSGGVGQGGSSVPEPATAVLALVAAVGSLVAKRKFFVSGF